METMNKQDKHFVSEIRECDLLHKTNPNLPSLRDKASLYDDEESFLPLRPNFVDETPLIDLEEVFNPSFTSLSFIASFLSKHTYGYSH